MQNKEQMTSFLEMLNRKTLKRNIHVLLKPVGPLCNLLCDYCYYIDKEHLFPKKSEIKDFSMSLETYEKFLDNYVAHQPNGSEITITWHGGEPCLLGLEYFQNAVKLSRSKYPDVNIQFVFQTNGTLITEDWARFFTANNFLIGLSIDGPENLHNAHRIYKNEKPTWKRVMQTVEHFHKHNTLFNTMTTVNSTNVKEPLEVYHFLKSIGSKWMQFLPIVELAKEDNQGNLVLTHNKIHEETYILEETVDPLLFGKFLNSIFDEWYKYDVGKIGVNLFENAFAGVINQVPMQCTMQPICGAALALEHNGDLFSCDHYVFPEFKLGNIHENDFSLMVNSKQQEDFGCMKELSLPKECRNCSFLTVCGGDCPKHRTKKTPEGEDISHLCAGFKNFFAHSKPYLKKIAQRQK